MGNGFPVGGILIHPDIKSSPGLLGTTFGGNHLACVATLTVLNVLEQEQLLPHAAQMEGVFRTLAEGIPGLKQVRGKGLMLGLEMDFQVADLRKKLLYTHRIFTGNSKNKNLLRILPPLRIEEKELQLLFSALKKELL
jgi:acetylornithine aminotransferase